MIIPEKAIPPMVIQTSLPFVYYIFQIAEEKRSKIPFFFSFLLIELNMFKLKTVTAVGMGLITAWIQVSRLLILIELNLKYAQQIQGII